MLGSLAVVQKLFGFADNVVSAATGLELLSVNLARATIAQTAVIGVDKACLATCNTPSTSTSPKTSG